MTLYLLPNLLAPEAKPEENFVPALKGVVDSIHGFFVEDPKEARKFLKHFDFAVQRDKPMEIIDKRALDYAALLEPLKKGENWGVVTDSGLPCLADPGTRLVSEARKRGIEVVAFPGPCSIILALMLSGLDANRFVFEGYFPDHAGREIGKEKKTQVFIQTPYKNHQTIEKLTQLLDNQDVVCVACDLTLPTQSVVTKEIGDWKKGLDTLDYHKRPAIFIIKIHN